MRVSVGGLIAVTPVICYLSKGGFCQGFLCLRRSHFRPNVFNLAGLMNSLFSVSSAGVQPRLKNQVSPIFYLCESEGNELILPISFFVLVSIRPRTRPMQDI